MSYTKVVVSGSLIEVYKYAKSPANLGATYRERDGVVFRETKPRKKNRHKRPRGVNRRRGDNLLRLRKGFVRLVRSNLNGALPPSFITLTFFDDVRTEEGYTCLSDFMAFLRRNFGEDVKYIAVPEFQKRGTLHFHCLVWGLPEKIVFDETPYVVWCHKTRKQQNSVRRFFSWCAERSLDPTTARGTRFLQNHWSQGYLDVLPTDGSPALAAYVSKYMFKAMLDDRLNGIRAFVCSRNVVRPVSLPGVADAYFPELFGELGVDIDLLTERSFETQWLGSAVYKCFEKIKPQPHGD